MALSLKTVETGKRKTPASIRTVENACVNKHGYNASLEAKSSKRIDVRSGSAKTKVLLRLLSRSTETIVLLGLLLSRSTETVILLGLLSRSTET